MLIPDVNVLVPAFRRDHSHHSVARRWLIEQLSSAVSIGLVPPVLTGTIRVLTLAKATDPPDDIDTALGHLEALRRNDCVSDVAPGPRHFALFAELCRTGGASGNLVPDAAIAAIAIEHGATVVSFDRDFARFPGLRWRLPS